ncbi:DUF3168 domain-containing protein [Sphingomonas sp. C3-2]|uniref:DUF3168 domain-containing protein n=1 Tax=Sphingomonas sp. C3-2 TaxID=3062169 RepID=UPI00294AFC43|nr:DUF3168 domain-containing protein [Sphingomonas sp. C3-2]WOK36305.1 DUF3168 domain-containing protein [Sphingomonas sp. C3-2]
MNAHAAVEAAVIDALNAHAPFREGVNGVHLMRPVRATPPYALIGESLSGDWGTKDADGREVRIALSVRDAADGPARLYRLMAAAEEALAGLGRQLDGWRVASIAFLRSRITREGDRSWTGMIEYRVRVLASG